MARIFIVYIIFFYQQGVFANSCCGQSPASFPILSLEQKLSLNATYSTIEGAGRIFNSDEFYEWNQKKRLLQAWQMNISGTLYHRHQYFINSSFLKSKYEDGTTTQDASHWSDTLLGYSYEILPEYQFSPWRPVVHTTLLVNLPTGKSIYDSPRLGEAADVTGHHQWGFGWGLTARKVYFPLTLTLQARTLYLFSKRFSTVDVSDFFDSSLAMLASYTTRLYSITLNSGLTLNHLSSRTIRPGGTSQSSQNFSVLLGLQKPLSDEWALGVHYSDQTLVGPAKNSVLNKTVSLNLNYNYF